MLVKLGPDAAPAIPLLLPLLDSQDFSTPYIVRDVLQATGKAATPALIEALEHRDAKVRGRAALLLSEKLRLSKDAVPALTKLLKDDDPKVRMRAAWALWENEERGEEILKIVVEGFPNEDSTFAAPSSPRLSCSTKTEGRRCDLQGSPDAADVSIKVRAAEALWRWRRTPTSWCRPSSR